MSTISHPTPASSRPEWLRTALVSLACLEMGYTLLQSLKLVPPVDVQIANGHLAGQITAAHLIVGPMLAMAALVFAIRNRLPEAIMALAAILLTTWASELLPEHFTGITLVLADVVRPVVAVLAIVLAVSRTWLGFATLLVSSAWLLWFWATFLSEVFPFLIGVMIYGA